MVNLQQIKIKTILNEHEYYQPYSYLFKNKKTCFARNNWYNFDHVFSKNLTVNYDEFSNKSSDVLKTQIPNIHNPSDHSPLIFYFTI